MDKRNENSNEQKKGFYERHYRKLLFIPLLLLAVSLAMFAVKYVSGQELVKKDVTLTGGTTLTVYTEQSVDLERFKSELSLGFEDIIVRKLSEVGTGKQIGFVVETSAEDIDTLKTTLSEILQIELTEENLSVEFTGPSLSTAFFSQLVKAIILAFIFMSIVVVIIFRVFTPAFAVVFAALADILVTLAFVSSFGVRLGTAGIAALLMLIGYSVDTDIMLTTRLLRRKEQEVSSRTREAAKTGLTMTITSLLAMFIAYIFVVSPVLKQIFLILSVGLSVDLINTWFFNAPLLRIYLDKKTKTIE